MQVRTCGQSFDWFSSCGEALKNMLAVNLS